MNTSRKSDSYQINNDQAMYGYNMAECKNIMTHETKNTSQPWNELFNTSKTSPQNTNKKNNCAETVDGDYIWVIEDSMQTLKTERYRLESSEIESVLLSHPDVQEVAVVGLPHEQKGNEIHVFVVLKQDTLLADNNIEQVLQELIQTEIGSIARPKSIEFIDYLVKTSSGEVMRKALKAQALEKKLMLLN